MQSNAMQTDKEEWKMKNNKIQKQRRKIIIIMQRQQNHEGEAERKKYNKNEKNEKIVEIQIRERCNNGKRTKARSWPTK